MTHFASAHRVVAIDLRGHGASDAPRERYTTISTFADDLAWMCAQLGTARAVVVGHSLSGLVVLELVISHPERVGPA
jgi:pimeloyl-ACP methyl ester carboxylesterase